MWLGTWLTSFPEAMGWEFWNLKKTSELRFGRGRSKSIFGARRGQTSSLRWGAARGRLRWKSQGRKKLCLSLLVSKNLKLKTVIKSFIPEPISSVFRIPMNMCKNTYDFTYSYLGRLFGPIYYRKLCVQKMFILAVYKLITDKTQNSLSLITEHRSFVTYSFNNLEKII